jgi:pyruvate dehydrogenase E2 component (dihydrolipoamide acetyltransferase)
MPTNVIMPALGVAQRTGTLLKWLKLEGQAVVKGEPLMEIETDKATVEIEAPASGVLAHVLAKAGDEVPVGQRMAFILATGEALPAIVDPAPMPQTRAAVLQPESKAETQRATYGNATALPPLGRVLASPAARRMAREKRIDLAALKGTGPEGSVLADDVLRATSGATTPTPAALPVAELVPLTSMRRIVGERMTQSKQTAPHFYLGVEIDMTAVTEHRAAWKELEKPLVPSLNDYILYACARALRECPSLNSSFSDQGIRLHGDINLGVAVALEEGLVVPVIRNADRLDLVTLGARSRELGDKAQTKKLLPADYEDGTFTVSNLGMLGVDSFTAIINPPQCAILAVGRVAPRVVAADGMFAIKSMMTATLSADHRVVDGAAGARFLRWVKQALERGEF